MKAQPFSFIEKCEGNCKIIHSPILLETITCKLTMKLSKGMK
jgi:hypothetical protein